MKIENALSATHHDAARDGHERVCSRKQSSFVGCKLIDIKMLLGQKRKKTECVRRGKQEKEYFRPP
jgi:hypothetical protein